MSENLIGIILMISFENKALRVTIVTIYIPDVMQALLEQEQQGNLVIYRYDQLTPRMLQWDTSGGNGRDQDTESAAYTLPDG